jgi:hypothetical protein
MLCKKQVCGCAGANGTCKTPRWDCMTPKALCMIAGRGCACLKRMCKTDRRECKIARQRRDHSKCFCKIRVCKGAGTNGTCKTSGRDYMTLKALCMIAGRSCACLTRMCKTARSLGRLESLEANAQPRLFQLQFQLCLVYLRLFQTIYDLRNDCN